MNFAQRLKELNDARLTTPEWGVDQSLPLSEQSCPFCWTTGSLYRETDYCFHDNTRLDIAIAFTRHEAGSVCCRFCQKEIPGTEINRFTLADKPKAQTPKFKLLPA